MRSESITVEVLADTATTFAVIHDYASRLTWDTMLSKAVLLDGASSAAKGVRSLCVGDWKSAYIPMETEYITFEPGQHAAVQLTRKTWFFENFAASIRHRPVDEQRSEVIYTYSFRIRPRWLTRVLRPIINRLLRREVENRLEGLRSYLATLAA